MGNRSRTIELSTVPVRDHCPSGEGRHNAIWLRAYDPLFVVSARTCRTCGLYEKIAFKFTSAEPPPRWAIGTGQSSCRQFRSGTIARRGGGGIIPFGSAPTTHYSLWAGSPRGRRRLPWGDVSRPLSLQKLSLIHNQALHPLDNMIAHRIHMKSDAGFQCRFITVFKAFKNFSMFR